MKFKIEPYSILEYGTRVDADGKPHQEDCLYPDRKDLKPSDRMFILCDGMGGHDSGEVASATVCEAMSSAVNSATREFSEGVFLKALRDAYDALDAKDNGAPKKMGTTMTFLKLYDEGAFIAHIGDSRVYHIRPGKTADETQILFETSDHSLVNELVKIGEITHEQARMSKQKNILSRAMQPDMDRRSKADIYQTSDILPGDYFYMCSDGMLEHADMEDGTMLRHIFSDEVPSDHEKVEALKKATADNHDNHTAFVIHVVDVKGMPTGSPRSSFSKIKKTIVVLIIAALIIAAVAVAVGLFFSSSQSASQTSPL